MDEMLGQSRPCFCLLLLKLSSCSRPTSTYKLPWQVSGYSSFPSSYSPTSPPPPPLLLLSRAYLVEYGVDVCVCPGLLLVGLGAGGQAGQAHRLLPRHPAQVSLLGVQHPPVLLHPPLLDHPAPPPPPRSSTPRSSTTLLLPRSLLHLGPYVCLIDRSLEERGAILCRLRMPACSRRPMAGRQCSPPAGAAPPPPRVRRPAANRRPSIGPTAEQDPEFGVAGARLGARGEEKPDKVHWPHPAVGVLWEGEGVKGVLERRIWTPTGEGREYSGRRWRCRGRWEEVGGGVALCRCLGPAAR